MWQGEGEKKRKKQGGPGGGKGWQESSHNSAPINTEMESTSPSCDRVIKIGPVMQDSSVHIYPKLNRMHLGSLVNNRNAVLRCLFLNIHH